MSSQGPGPKRRGKKVRVDLRRNRGKAVRDKPTLTRGDDAALEALDDSRRVENVRAKGDLSRKRTIMVPDAPADRATWRPAVVVTMRGLIVEVESEGVEWACTVRRMVRSRLIAGRAPIAVGDRVQFSPVRMAGEGSTLMSNARDMPEGVIEDILPRKTTLTRHYDRRDHVLAANVDTAVICMAVDAPTLRPHLIDRYLVAVHRGDMRPVICINKADLDVDGAAAAVVQRYCDIGYASILACVPEERGIDELREAVRGRTSVFVGPSGVGKSSIINRLSPGLNLKIGTLSDAERGRHTTTSARLFRWSFGGHLVDTPGIRQFDLPKMPPEELEAYFKEFVPLIQDCRFPDCTHTHETDCAVLAAVEGGRIAPERYESYCRMFGECEEKAKDYS